MGQDSSVGDQAFHTTRWTLVVRAYREGGEEVVREAREALEQLCSTYWYPLYALARREGLGSDGAEDAVQGFLAELLERRDLAQADPDQGRLRAYLSVAFRHYLSNERRRAGALKRGGDRLRLPMDPAQAEERYGGASGQALDPAALFDRAWALTLIEQVLAELEEGYRQRGRGAWFDALRPGLVGDVGLANHARAAEGLGSTEGEVKVAAHRLRERFREALLQAVAHTLEEPEAESQRLAGRQVELAALFAALGAG